MATSFDHGRSFPQVSRVIPQQTGNFGGRPFIAAGADGAVYLTWDYGPSAAEVRYICTKHGGGCGFKAGDLNIVLQKSTNFGLTWGPMTAMSPGYPASGADSAPMLVEPDGTIDMEYQDYSVTDPATLTLGPAHNYFTTSSDGGASWSAPVRVGPRWASMAPREWWIDGSIGRDTGGNLYVTWDSQRHGHDVGWLSFSTTGCRSWSSPVQVTRDRDNAPHIIEAVGGFRGTAYVGWLSDNSACGYVMRVRAYSIFSSWLSGPVRVAGRCDRRHVWPGGTFGFTALPPADLANGTWQLALSWAAPWPAGTGRRRRSSPAWPATPAPAERRNRARASHGTTQPARTRAWTAAAGPGPATGPRSRPAPRPGRSRHWIRPIRWPCPGSASRDP